MAWRKKTNKQQVLLCSRSSAHLACSISPKVYPIHMQYTHTRQHSSSAIETATGKYPLGVRSGFWARAVLLLPHLAKVTKTCLNYTFQNKRISDQELISSRPWFQGYWEGMNPTLQSDIIVWFVNPKLLNVRDMWSSAFRNYVAGRWSRCKAETLHPYFPLVPGSTGLIANRKSTQGFILLGYCLCLFSQ